MHKLFYSHYHLHQFKTLFKCMFSFEGFLFSSLLSRRKSFTRCFKYISIPTKNALITYLKWIYLMPNQLLLPSNKIITQLVLLVSFSFNREISSCSWAPYLLSGFESSEAYPHRSFSIVISSLTSIPHTLFGMHVAVRVVRYFKGTHNHANFLCSYTILFLLGWYNSNCVTCRITLRSLWGQIIFSELLLFHGKIRNTQF